MRIWWSCPKVNLLWLQSKKCIQFLTHKIKSVAKKKLNEGNCASSTSAGCIWLARYESSDKQGTPHPPHPSHRVHEDHRHLLLPHPLLPPAGLRHPAAQSGLCLWGAAVFWPLWRPPVAEVRLSKDSRGEAACFFFSTYKSPKVFKSSRKSPKICRQKRWLEVAKYTNTKFSNKVAKLATQVTVRVNFTSIFNLRDPTVRL